MDQLAGGVFGSKDGTMDPNAVLMGYKNKAVALGAEYIVDEVLEIVQTDGQVSGVRLASGEEFSANYVVNSAGWGQKMARTLGIELPVDPVKRQVFVLETNAEPGEVVYPLTVFPSGLSSGR